MRAVAIVTVCVALVVGAASVPDADAAIGRHTKPRAERNIMLAHRVLARWRVGLVNPRTRVPYNNVWVRCVGRGRRTDAGYTQFRCTIGYRRVRVIVRYMAKTKNGFELHDRRVFRL